MSIQVDRAIHYDPATQALHPDAEGENLTLTDTLTAQTVTASGVVTGDDVTAVDDVTAGDDVIAGDDVLATSSTSAVRIGDFPAASGALGLLNNDWAKWRNAAGTDDLNGIKYDSSDRLLLGAQPYVEGTLDRLALVRLGRDSYNLLTNPGPTLWQRGTSFASIANGAYGPDLWVFAQGAASTLTITQETSTIPTNGRFTMKFAYTHGASSAVQQKIEDFAPLRGRIVTFSAQVSVATASAVRLGIHDSVNGWRYGSYHAGSGGFATLTVTASIAAAATAVNVAIWLDASCTAYVGHLSLVNGSIAVDYVPLHPAEDLARCLRYYQVLGGTDTYESFCHGAAISTTTMIGTIYYTPKAAVPTITHNAAASGYLADPSLTPTAVTASRITRSSAQLSWTFASGATAGYGGRMMSNGVATSLIIIEANP